MTFLITFVITIVACFVLREPIKRWPVVFYVLAVAVDVFFIYGSFVGLPRSVWMAFYEPIQKALVPLAIFVVVMYIGVFSRQSKVSTWLRPIRAELSIIATLLCAGHIVVYINSYLPRLFNGSTVNTNVAISFAVAIVTLILLLILGITSFQVVKKRMTKAKWKALQRWAYVFFMAVYVHLVLMLAPAALHGGIASTQTVIIYSIIFGVWLVARIARAVVDRKRGLVDGKKPTEADTHKGAHAA